MNVLRYVANVEVEEQGQKCRPLKPTGMNGYGCLVSVNRVNRLSSTCLVCCDLLVILEFLNTLKTLLASLMCETRSNALANSIKMTLYV